MQRSCSSSCHSRRGRQSRPSPSLFHLKPSFSQLSAFPLLLRLHLSCPVFCSPSPFAVASFSSVSQVTPLVSQEVTHQRDESPFHSLPQGPHSLRQFTPHWSQRFFILPLTSSFSLFSFAKSYLIHCASQCLLLFLPTHLVTCFLLTLNYYYFCILKDNKGINFLIYYSSLNVPTPKGVVFLVLFPGCIVNFYLVSVVLCDGWSFFSLICLC